MKLGVEEVVLRSLISVLSQVVMSEKLVAPRGHVVEPAGRSKVEQAEVALVSV